MGKRKPATCTIVPAMSLDKAISSRFMQVIQPAELELSIQSMEKLLNEDDNFDKGWKLLIEHERYKMERAERQYQQVEPENRLVVRNLENQWNVKLLALEQLQKDYA